MSNRITNKDLEHMLARINSEAGKPLEPYTQDSEGRYRPNAGTYVLDSAYGGVRLSQMSQKEGCSGTRDITGLGTKRETHLKMHAFLRGMQAKSQHKQKGKQ